MNVNICGSESSLIFSGQLTVSEISFLHIGMPMPATQRTNCGGLVGCVTVWFCRQILLLPVCTVERLDLS